jgi:hypothetical protein
VRALLPLASVVMIIVSAVVVDLRRINKEED